MLGRTIYEEGKRDIQDHANTYSSELRNQLQNEKSLYKAVTAANVIANRYHSTLTQTIYSRLHQIAENAVEYYGSPTMDPLVKDRAITDAIDELTYTRYYGLTLPQRLKQSHLQLRSNIRKSSAVGKDINTKLTNITRVLNDKYPFGAHKHWDMRLFLSEAVRLEHIVAKNLAGQRGRKVMRWTLSHTHSQTDICDRLASAVDPEVQAYLEANNYNIDPDGVYFVENLPGVPHPNCQCVIKYVRRRRTGTRPTPPPHKEGLIRRIIKAIFG